MHILNLTTITTKPFPNQFYFLLVEVIVLTFRAKTADLVTELGLLQSVVEKRTTIPILSHVLLDASGDGLALTGTDLDLSLTTRCQAEIDCTGSVTILAKKLFEIVRNLPHGEVHFQVDSSNRIQISCERSRFKLSGLERESFPEVPKPVDAWLSLPAEMFRDFVQRTMFATTQEESRYALSGVQLEVVPASGSVRMIATDGHRLALVEGELGGGGSEEMRILIPKKALVELMKLGGADGESVEVGKDDNHIYFRLGKRNLSSRVLVGQFPNYEMVLPKDNARVAEVPSEAFAAALRRVAIVSDERSRAIRLQVGVGRFDLSAARAEGGEEAAEDLLVKYDGDEFEIGFNSSFLLEFFAAVPSGDVRMEFKDSRGPILMRPIGGKYDYRYVVMPLRV